MEGFPEHSEDATKPCIFGAHGGDNNYTSSSSKARYLPMTPAKNRRYSGTNMFCRQGLNSAKKRAKTLETGAMASCHRFVTDKDPLADYCFEEGAKCIYYTGLACAQTMPSTQYIFVVVGCVQWRRKPSKMAYMLVSFDIDMSTVRIEEIAVYISRLETRVMSGSVGSRQVDKHVVCVRRKDLGVGQIRKPTSTIQTQNYHSQCFESRL